jgi:hypothetical protein
MFLVMAGMLMEASAMTLGKMMDFKKEGALLMPW